MNPQPIALDEKVARRQLWQEIRAEMCKLAHLLDLELDDVKAMARDFCQQLFAKATSELDLEEMETLHYAIAATRLDRIGRN